MTLTEEEKNELKGRLLGFVSRKFILSVVILVVSTVMVANGSLEADMWLKIVVADLLGHNFANAFSKRAK